MTENLLENFPKSNSLHKGEILVALAKIAPDVCLQQIQKTESADKQLRAKMAEALGYIDRKDSVALLRKMSATKDMYVLQTVVASLGKMTCEDTTASILKSLDCLDMAVVTYAAGALAEKKVISSIGKLAEIYGKLKTPQDIEPMQAIVDAIGKLTEKSNEVGVNFLKDVVASQHHLLSPAAAEYLKKMQVEVTPASKYPSSTKKILFSYEDICQLQPYTVEVETTRGKFIMKAFVREAPIASLNFYRLINKGLYNNLSFHRVIANFVAQGGDPRGDGWGGPGYNIPCEYNTVRYERGMVGMPLAGKDTGGCQLFITHSPQPHLNGKYTIFGKVIQGMDVVDLLQQGDTIKKMTTKLLEAPKSPKVQKEEK